MSEIAARPLPPLGDADRALVHVALLICCGPVAEGERLELWRLELADLAARWTRTHPQLGPLAEAADAFVELGDLTDGTALRSAAWSRVSWRLRLSARELAENAATAAVDRARREAAA